MEHPNVAFIIRTKNEERWIGECLRRVFDQTYRNVEVIVIDSGSRDRTLEIVSQFPVRLLRISPEDFSYPYALNHAIERASATVTHLVMISAHSLPISNEWLADGLSNFKEFKKVAGVYGPLRPLPGATFWDWFFQAFLGFLKTIVTLKKRRAVITDPLPGVIGFTNAIIPKELWERKKFDESYGAGGEDQEWATYWLSQGYCAIRDRNFIVRHSHYLGLRGWIAQRKYWQSVATPRPFKSLSFRKDGAHTQ
jgi:glycosyltransferase involved in cell wall biosynthesis